MNNLKIPLSAIILTYNESINIESCIKSLNFCSQILVVDSYSTDNTVKIANDLGCDTILKKFESYSLQRNFSIKNDILKNDYVLVVDADEIISDNLRLDILSKFDLINLHSGYKIERLDYLDGKPLKYVQISKEYIRIFNRHNAEYHREINESIAINGSVSRLSGCIHHFPFSKGMHHWVDKHNIYSTMESNYLYPSFVYNDFLNLFNLSEVIRRPSQKKLFNLLPFKVLIKFIYMYIFRFGFLDGLVGLKYIILQCIYEYLIVIKRQEKRNEKNIIC
jgi:glycosyltransferase involved in cell wall biosynthesis